MEVIHDHDKSACSAGHSARRCLAVILASGEGSRIGGKPKQFRRIGGRELFLYSAESFALHPQVTDIGICAPACYHQAIRSVLSDAVVKKLAFICEGGKTRQESSRRAVAAASKLLPDDGDDCVLLIHDASRPGVDSGVISRVLEAAEKYGAACPALPCVDTLLFSRDGETVLDIPPRSRFFRAQTPQGFRFSLIKEAHLLETGAAEITDDCGLVMLLGREVHIVEGSHNNEKITVLRDLEQFEQNVLG